MDPESIKFLTERFDSVVNVADKRRSFKLANFRQRLSHVATKALADQMLTYLNHGMFHRIFGHVDVPSQVGEGACVCCVGVCVSERLYVGYCAVCHVLRSCVVG